MLCKECEINYPDDLLAPFTMTCNHETKRVQVCGICALKLANELHGTVRTKFTGTNAELLRQRAIGFRRKRGLPES